MWICVILINRNYLVLDNYKEISPKDVKIGTRLLHHRNLYNAEYNKNNAYLGHENDNNVYDEFSTHSQINAAIYWNKHCNNLDHTLLIKNDYFNKLSLRIVKVAQSSLPLNAYNCVKNIFEIDYVDGQYVYDLTTDNHHFAAGVGDLIVHNTDSVFFTFNLATPDGIPIRGKDALEITIEFAKHVGHKATSFSITSLFFGLTAYASVAVSVVHNSQRPLLLSSNLAEIDM